MSYAYDDVFQDLRRILTYVRIHVCNIYEIEESESARDVQILTKERVE